MDAKVPCAFLCGGEADAHLECDPPHTPTSRAVLAAGSTASAPARQAAGTQERYYHAL